MDSHVVRDLLDGHWAKVRAEARDLNSDPRFAVTFGLDVDEQRDRVLAQLRVLADSGYSALGFPAAYGGRGDIGGAVTAFEMLAFGDLSLLVKAGVQWGLFGGAVLNLGTEQHHRRYLADIMSLALPGCFAMTETGHGSNVAALQTTAVYAGGEFIVNTPLEAARKDYIGNAARDGRMAVVFAQLATGGESRGVHAFLVPIRDGDGVVQPGVTVQDDGLKGGLNGVDNGRLTFDHVRIPRENLLDRYGCVGPDGTYTTAIENPNKRFFTMIGTLIQGRVSIAGGAGSATKVALTIAVRYAEARRQFGAPDSPEITLLDYQAHQRKLLPLLAKSYALQFAQNELVERLDEAFSGEQTEDKQQLHRELEARAAGLKAISTWHASHTIQTCREACGGQGYLAENRLAGLKADTDVFTTFEGDNTVLLQLVAKELLTGYRDHFGDLDMLGTIRFVAESAVESVLETTRLPSLLQRLRDAVPGEDDLLDREAQLSMLAWREQHLLETLARRLRRASDTDDPAAAFSASQGHLLALARAHVDGVLAQAFVAAIERCLDPEAAALLGTVCDLFILSTLEADRAYFLEHGRLTAARSKALIGQVDALDRELRPQARLLVDAFAVSDAHIAAPIALGDEQQRQDEAR